MPGEEPRDPGGGPEIKFPVEERPERFSLCPGLRQQVAQEDRREDEDPVIFRGHGQSAQESRQQVIAPAAALGDAGAKIERQGEKEGHRDVEGDLVAEQDGNESHGIQE